MKNQVGYIIASCGFVLGVSLYVATVLINESPAQMDYYQKEQMAALTSQVKSQQLLQRRIALQKKMIINYTQEIRDLQKLGLSDASPELHFAREQLGNAQNFMNECYYELNACKTHP